MNKHYGKKIWAVYIGYTQIELLDITLSLSVLWITELLHTSIEKFQDLLQPEFDQRVKVVKDLAGAAVFSSTLTLFLVFCIINFL